MPLSLDHLCQLTLVFTSLVKVKGKGQDICYSAAYMSQTRDQQRFYNLGSGS